MLLQPLEMLAIMAVIPLLLYSFFLFSLKKKDNRNHIFLGLFLLTMALYTLNFLMSLLKKHIPLDLDSLTLIGRSLSFLLGPFLYFYINSRCQKKIRFNVYFFLHFSPFLFSLFYYVYIYNDFFVLFYSFKYLQLLFYVPFMIVSLRTYKVKIKDYYSSVEHIYVRHLWIILFLYIFLLIIDIIFFASAIFISLPPPIDTVLIFISMFLTFVLPYFIIYDYTKYPELFTLGGKGRVGQKYESSTISKEQSEVFSKKLIKILEAEKLYQDPLLSLEKLAAKTKISPRILSQVINESLGKSFSDLVNSYRIEESKKILISQKDKTIMALMFEVGFNSKSVFNTAFKNQTGLTPTQFRKNN
jgi:AraC-like DNA-binding protein